MLTTLVNFLEAFSLFFNLFVSPHSRVTAVQFCPVSRIITEDQASLKSQLWTPMHLDYLELLEFMSGPKKDDDAIVYLLLSVKLIAVFARESPQTLFTRIWSHFSQFLKQGDPWHPFCPLLSWMQTCFISSGLIRLGRDLHDLLYKSWNINSHDKADGECKDLSFPRLGHRIIEETLRNRSALITT